MEEQESLIFQRNKDQIKLKENDMKDPIFNCFHRRVNKKNVQCLEK